MSFELVFLNNNINENYICCLKEPFNEDEHNREYRHRSNINRVLRVCYNVNNTNVYFYLWAVLHLPPNCYWQLLSKSILYIIFSHKKEPVSST